MRKLITICTVLSLMLISTSVSLASSVMPPPGTPSWWNSETGNYAYAWWSADIIGGGAPISPPTDSSHWASNYLPNTAFTASIGWTDDTISLNLGNVFNPDLYKQIYVYATGTTISIDQDIFSSLNTDSGVFSGGSTWNIDKTTGLWDYVLSGTITPQPEFVNLTLTVPGMTSVTNIWAGERCIPEPATLCLLGLGALSLVRRKKSA
jgi:hypothetical protein